MLGYKDAADRIQDLFLSRRRAEAIEAVPDEYCDEMSLIRPPARIKECYRRWEHAGVTATTIRRPGGFLGQDSIPAQNLYAYVANNPTNWLDPSGLLIWIGGEPGRPVHIVPLPGKEGGVPHLATTAVEASQHVPWCPGIYCDMSRIFTPSSVSTGPPSTRNTLPYRANSFALVPR